MTAEDGAIPRSSPRARWLDESLRRGLGPSAARMERLIGYAATTGTAALVDLGTGRALVVVGESLDAATLAELVSAARALAPDTSIETSASHIVGRVGTTHAIAVGLREPVSGARARVESACGILARALRGTVHVAPPTPKSSPPSGAPAHAFVWALGTRRRGGVS